MPSPPLGVDPGSPRPQNSPQAPPHISGVWGSPQEEREADGDGGDGGRLSSEPAICTAVAPSLPVGPHLRPEQREIQGASEIKTASEALLLRAFLSD